MTHHRTAGRLGRAWLLAAGLAACAELDVGDSLSGRDAAPVWRPIDAAMSTGWEGAEIFAVGPACPVGVVIRGDVVAWQGSCGTWPALVAVHRTGGTPVTLVSGEPGIEAPLQPSFYGDGVLALDDEAVYWRSTSGVMRTPLAGGAPSPVSPTYTGDAAGPIAVDDSAVYWMNLTHLLRAEKAGGATTRLVVAYGSARIALDVDAERLYWLDGLLRSVPLLGGAVTTHGGVAGPVALRGDEESLYVATEMALLRVRKSDGAITTLTEDVGVVAATAQDADRVYWSDYAHLRLSGLCSRIVSICKSGGAPELLAEGVGLAAGVAVDEQRVYFPLTEVGSSPASAILTVPKPAAPCP